LEFVLPLHEVAVVEVEDVAAEEHVEVELVLLVQRAVVVVEVEADP